MEVSRRGFLGGVAALSATAIAADPVLGKVVMSREAPRQAVKLENHKTWELVRPHVLGHLSLEEMATGLPGPWQEFLASWWVEGPKVHMPILHRETPFDKESFLGAKLKSGYLMHLDEKCWKPFYDKWNREVCVPLYGQEIHTINLGPAILTNISLFRMAVKYSVYKSR